MRAKRICRVIPVILALSLIFAGCGNRDKPKADLVDSDDNTGAGSDMEYIDPHISYTVTGSGGRTNVLDADVMAEGYAKAGVYDMELVDVDEAYLRKLAGQLFDGGEYEVVKPYAACTLEELTAERDYIQQLYGAEGIKEPETLPLPINNYIDYYDETEMEEWQEGQFFSYETDAAYGDVERKSVVLRGRIDDRVYQLMYEEFVPGTEYINTGVLNLRAVCSMHRVFYDMCDADFEQASILYGENVCSREQAEQTAREIIGKLGFSGMQQVYTSQIIWYQDEEKYADGYSVIFTPVTDDIQNVFCENSLALLDDEYDAYMMYNDDNSGSCQEYIEVHVDSAGFLGCNFNVFYEMGERLAEEPVKLSFGQVCTVAEQYMQDNIDSVAYINEIRMGYLTLRYENRYVLAPVWVYLAEGSGVSSFAMFGVNALDGSIIHFDWNSRYGYLFTV